MYIVTETGTTDHIGGLIRLHRTRRQMSQTTLAARAGIGRSSLNQLENGQIGNITLPRLAQIARALGVTVHQLIPADY